MSAEIGVSKSAVYGQLNRLEPCVSRALVQSTALDLATLIRSLGGEKPEPLPGYRIRILDGNGHRSYRTSSVRAPRYQGRSIAREIFGRALPSTGASH